MKYLFAAMTFFSITLNYACSDNVVVYKDSDGFAAQTLRFTPKQHTNQTVLILPPTGGINALDRSYAKLLCRRGIKSIIITNWTGDDEVSFDIDVHDRLYHRGQQAIDLVVNKHQNEYLGILGTSVGSLHASIALARREELKAGFFIVGGGDIASIITDSDQDILEQAKEQRIEKYSFASVEEYRQALSESISLEPLDIDFDRDTRKVGMIISLNDSTVPTYNQNLKKDAWKPDVKFYSNQGHVTTVIKSWLLYRDDISDFFVRNLKQ